jgi:hypothetical protein
MGMDDLTSQNLHQWLEDRVQYILDESFDVNSRAYVAQPHYSYDNPGEMPSAGNSRQGLNDTQVQTLGLNLGTLVYLVGKQNHALLGLNISRLGSVPVTSPRTGLIEIGSGAFFSDPNELAGMIFTMSVLFHEARHGDGHGKTAGFTHVVCPAGHVYAGYAACDNNSNGPYTVQAEFVRTLAQTCMSCSSRRREFFSLIQTDFLSRVVPIHTTSGAIVPAGHWDDAPEGRR